VFAKSGRLLVWLLAAVMVAGLMAGAAGAEAPAGDVHGEFTLTVSSLYVRSLPDINSPPVFSIFAGDRLTLTGISSDGGWAQVSRWQMAGWVPLDAGMVTGPAADLVAPPPQAATTDALREAPAGVVPAISDQAREVYQRGLAQGNQPAVFAKVGDCNTENGRFLAMFDEPGNYRLGERYAYLQPTIDHYAGSFSHTSVAAHSGFSPASVLSPVWADPAVCRPGESPLQCEYRLVRPSVALVNLGTHPGPNPAEFEASLRLVIEESIQLGVVPILATKADDAEGGGWVNDIIRQLAADYEMPLWDFWKAAQPLPANGLAYTGIHLTYGRSYFDDPWAMTRGWTWRNLTALLSLDAAWRGLSSAPHSHRSLPEWR
jgi:hypothetical protein